MRRLRYYLWGSEDGDPDHCEHAPALQYFENTRMQAVGVDNSTKLSAFLAVGALSPRMVHDEVLRCAGARLVNNVHRSR